ncbi:carbon monoxide dehydrogenase subunit G [Sulfitobacter sp. PR48]|jgi:carbon monoxide dehydrogenase subunit G|uniref:CoxG family protein n=1 Tax=unclassified Sulfitobacter TaxID=196795 RepID=UPI0022AF54AB|nr:MULTISPECIES: carbon monoxide dehydrogenase subunit G [unclassified Sulfitobacter]MCZ4254577.1 carbon monoxide dehydrogenase subunit G [Sulfitobacter sp. G21635-S1]MDD9720208.1 carbon monoxide dehydrogenase subunit G [Sulfitobacter sp. PR48]
MQMSDTRQIAAPPSEVYAALLDPQVLKACVPGATEVTGSVEEGYEATVVQKVGPVKATFKGEVTITDLVADQSMKIDGAGKGGAAGFAKGGADVRLAAKDGGTELSYDVEAKVGGKLAQLGSRIIDGFAKKMADQFFDNLQAALEGPAEDAGGDDAEEAPRKKGWFGRSKD